MSLPTNQQKAYQSLLALSVGDATGEAHLGSAPQTEYKAGNVRELRNAMMQEITGYLPWTDDTAMAIGVYRILTKYGTINQIELAKEFARNAKADPQRGYGNGTARLLFTYLYDAENWESQSRNWWGPGVGSKGNGSAMRDSIIGPFFGSDLDRVVSEATASAQVTHWHDDAIAGSVAVAVAAAIVSTCFPNGGSNMAQFWPSIISRLPDGEMKSRILAVYEESKDLTRTNWNIVGMVGNGGKVTALDTVPFALWQAYKALTTNMTFEQTLDSIIEVGGDTDTVGAIVGGIIGNRIKPPKEWIDRTEKLPADIQEP